MSDAYSVIYSPEAKSDIKDIYSYIAFELLVPRTAESHGGGAKHPTPAVRLNAPRRISRPFFSASHIL